EKGHPLLWRSYIKPVSAALPREVQDFNDDIAKFGAKLVASTNIEHYKAAMNMKGSGYTIGSAFWEYAKQEFSEETMAFLASMAVKKDPRWICTNFIDARAPHRVNISSELRQQLSAAMNATPTHAALMPAVPEVCSALGRDTFRRFQHSF